MRREEGKWRTQRRIEDVAAARDDHRTLGLGSDLFHFGSDPINKYRIINERQFKGGKVEEQSVGSSKGA